ncbi:MAG: ATP-binding cassette domain-containing protein [Anaerolineae bacterium]
MDDVSIAFQPGRIHAVVGQNGAGKTTFARAVMGLVRPATGEVELAGRKLPPGDVVAARAAGIDMVHQSFALPPSFTVAEALELFVPDKGPVYRLGSMEARWDAILRESGVEAKPRTRVRDLPIETAQALEIVRALAGRPSLLILDEPTAVLPPPAIERLFARLRAIRASGVTILIVLHKVREVLDLADTVSVLRHAKLVLPPTPSAELTPARLGHLIVGSDEAEAVSAQHEAEAIEARVIGAAHHDAAGKAVLSLRGVSTAAAAAEAPLADVTMDIRPGEIVGIAGVEGNGQRSLVRAVVGLDDVTTGTLAIDGADVTRQGTLERRRRGLRAIPFDRNIEGISATSTLWENVAIGELLRAPTGRRLVRPGALRASARTALDAWNVKYRSVDQKGGQLSGGNIQRLIFSRELGPDSRLIVAAQPTRGLDLAATAFVRETLRDLRLRDAGVLLVSSDLDELFELSDRMLVVYGGRIVAEFRAPFTLSAVGAAMVGAGAHHDSTADAAPAASVGAA